LAPLPKTEALLQLEKWRQLLEHNLTSRDIVDRLDDYTSIASLGSVTEEIKYVYDMGHVVLILALRETFGLFFPALFVAEKHPRELLGSGDKLVREYSPLKVSGIPNFDRAIRSSLDLSIKLTDRPKKRDLPKGLMVAPDKDLYILHIGMIRVTPTQLEGIISILNEEQPLPNTPLIEDTPPEGDAGGVCMEACQEVSTSGEPEG
jgi:hypothetical protein